MFSCPIHPHHLPSVSQLNDDVRLLSDGWSTMFVDKYMENNDLGIVGPTDVLWGSKLLTQAFASRVHYTIFGRFYPLDIRVSWSVDKN